MLLSFGQKREGLIRSMVGGGLRAVDVRWSVVAHIKKERRNQGDQTRGGREARRAMAAALAGKKEAADNFSFCCSKRVGRWPSIVAAFRCC